MTCSTLTYPLNSHSDFPRAMPPTGISLMGQFSVALLPSHMDRTLAAAYELVSKPKSRDSQQVTQPTKLMFSSFSIRVVAFPMRCCLLTLKLPSINQTAPFWSIESYSDGTAQVTTGSAIPQVVPKSVLGQKSLPACEHMCTSLHSPGPCACKTSSIFLWNPSGHCLLH